MRFKEKFVLLFVIFVCWVNFVQAKSECGVPNLVLVSKIFGGEQSVKEEFSFPWLVALYHRFARTFFCAGSLISEKHVLSGKTGLC